jgi:hypothetical protein
VVVTPVRSKEQFRWPVFSLILAGPAILTFVLVSFFSNSNQAMNLLVITTFGGCPLAGIISAILFVRWQEGGNVIRGIVFSVLLSVVSFALCFAGCAIGAVVLSSVNR